MILTGFLVISLIAFISGQSLNHPKCGTRPLAKNKIYNGQDTTPGDWAWSVSLSSYSTHFCGATLVGDGKFVLTAAHCFMDGIPQDLVVDIGLYNRQSKESYVQTRRSARVIIHEQFQKPRYLQNDVALIKLDRPVVIDGKYIIPACLPENPGEIGKLARRDGVVTGWGSAYLNGPTSMKKMQVTLPIGTDRGCYDRFIPYYYYESQLCAGEKTGDKGMCQGDSGGPFVIQHTNSKWYVVGIPSFVLDCKEGGVFTRVEYFMSWIKQKMQTY